MAEVISIRSHGKNLLQSPFARWFRKECEGKIPRGVEILRNLSRYPDSIVLECLHAVGEKEISHQTLLRATTYLICGIVEARKANNPDHRIRGSAFWKSLS